MLLCVQCVHTRHISNAYAFDRTGTAKRNASHYWKLKEGIKLWQPRNGKWILFWNFSQNKCNYQFNLNRIAVRFLRLHFHPKKTNHRGICAEWRNTFCANGMQCVCVHKLQRTPVVACIWQQIQLIYFAVAKNSICTIVYLILMFRFAYLSPRNTCTLHTHTYTISDRWL